MMLGSFLLPVAPQVMLPTYSAIPDLGLSVDSLFQDIWLFVLSVRNNKSITVDDALYRQCSGMVKQAQEKLHKNDAALAEEMTFSLCALLDETVMNQPDSDTSAWHRNGPLQSRFFSRLDAGDRIPERIKTLLRQPAPSLLLVNVYLRLLQLGFCGVYRQENNPQRLELINKLQRLLPATSEALPDTVTVAGRCSRLYGLSSPWVLMGTALLMVFIGWLTLHAALVSQLTRQ